MQAKIPTINEGEDLPLFLALCFLRHGSCFAALALLASCLWPGLLRPLLPAVLALLAAWLARQAAGLARRPPAGSRGALCSLWLSVIDGWMDGLI